MNQPLFELARKTREHSYSPYSNRKVGAAVQTQSGKLYGGCNIENSSYGGTNCAERIAIQNAVSAEGKVEITEVIVVTDANPAWPPCGLCRQVIMEFSTPETRVTWSDLKGRNKTMTLSELLPEAFSPKHLKP